MCDNPPATVDPPENYFIDNALRNVGQIVTVYCRNTTVAILKCLPDLKWNATVPACPASGTTKDNLSEMLIIVWVVGAILLLALIILIVIIVRSRSKHGCRSRSPTSSPTSIFHITGHRREGGDNPAFSRADERCGEWSFHRAADLQDSTRLPSYQEAILNHYITVPARAGNLNPERTNFVRSNAPPSYRTSQQPSNSNASDNITTGAVSQNTPAQTTSDNRNSPPQITASQRAHEVNTNNPQEDNVPANRYAENYPQCFFEDEPPPPYTPGPSNYNMYRSPVRHSHPQRGAFSRRNIRAQTRARSRSPPRRDSVQRANAGRALQQRASHSNHIPAQPHSNFSQVATESSSVPIERLNDLNSNTKLNSIDASTTNPFTSQPQGGDYGIDITITPAPSTAISNSNTIAHSNFSESGSENSQNRVRTQREHINIPHQTNDGSGQHEPLYVIRNTKQTPEGYNLYKGQPSLMLPHPYSTESQPIGTSTPIQQSPAVARRFIPENRPSPLPIPRHFHPSGFNSQQEQYIFYTGSTTTNGLSQQAPQNCGYPVHVPNSCAPLARLDVEYF